MEKKFLVIGMQPYAGKEVNDFIASCDLGIVGGFYKSSYRLTATISSDVTPEQTARQIPAIKAAFEAQGWRSVKVVEDKPKEATEQNNG